MTTHSPFLASLAFSLAACATGSHGDPVSFWPFVLPTAASPAPSTVAQLDATVSTVQGTDASQEDSPRDDASAPDDAGEAAISVAAATPSPGDLVISEVMYAPSGPLPDFQWFEVCNLTGTPLSLGGLTIDDGQGDYAFIPTDPPVVVDPYALALVVRSLTGAAAAQVPSAPIVYEYGAGWSQGQGIQLATDATGDLALWNGGTLLADVPYGTWGLGAPGQSVELSPLRYAGADQPGNWCAASFPWASGSDEGTPGQPSDCF
jgi:hypothetical protein